MLQRPRRFAGGDERSGTMAGYKGTGVVFARSFVRDRAGGAELEEKLLAELSAADVAVYRATVATDWVPIEAITNIFVAMAPLVFPGRPNALREIGRLLAHDNLGGVYRFMLRVATPAFVVEQTGKLWRTYHQAGRAEILESSPHRIILAVRDYPSLPERFREALCGYMTGTIELTGAKRVSVLCGEPLESDGAFTWKVTWA